MHTTPHHTRVDYHRIGQDLTREFLDARAGLPKSGNGAPIAPSNPRAAQIAKDMGQGKTLSFEQILTVAVTNVVDGVPVRRVTSALRIAIALLEGVADARKAVPAPRGSFAAFVRSEAKVHAKTECAALHVLEAPTSEPALRTVVHECDAEISTLLGIRTAAERALAALPMQRRAIGTHRVRVMA